MMGLVASISRGWWCVVLLSAVVGLSVCPSVANARPKRDKKEKKPSKADVKKAKRFFQDGKAQQDAGNYPRAAENYRKAYDLFPTPILLFNLGQVYRLDGKKHLAIDYYKRYLEAEANGRGSDLAKKFLTELEAQLASEERAEREREQQEAERRKKELEADREKEESKGDEDEVFEDEVTTDSGSSSGTILKWSGIGTAAAGAIALGIGIKFGIDAKNISDELSAVDDEWTPELLAKEDEGASAETKMFIFSAAGSAAIIGGAVLYYFGYRADQSTQERMTVLPTGGANHVGFALTGTF